MLSREKFSLGSAMHRIVWAISLLLAPVFCKAAAPPATATAPATRGTETESLADGTIRYVPPTDWDLIEKTPDGLSAKYRSHDQTGTIQIIVMPQTQAMGDTQRERMASVILKGLREAGKKNGMEYVDGPKIERDPRFYLRVRDTSKAGEGFFDRIQTYRVMGLNLVYVVASATGEQQNTAQDVFDTADELLLNAKLSRGGKRVIYPHAQLRAVVPIDWTDHKTDQPNGLVATYTNPKDPTQQIILSARIIPKAAQADKEKLDALVASMIEQERKLPAKLAEAKVEDQPTTSPATNAVRQTRMKVMTPTGTLEVETRYQVVGDVLASVRSIAKESDAADINLIAERFAASLKPIK